MLRNSVVRLSVTLRASEEEIGSLARSQGRVVVLLGTKYRLSNRVTLLVDSDSSVYAFEKDLEDLMKM